MSNKLIFTNSSSNNMRLILEPWAEEYSIESNSTVEIIADNPSGKEIEIEYNDKAIIIYGWADSMVVQCNGSTLDPQFE